MSFRKPFKTLMSMKKPDLATLLNCFHKESFFLLINAAKFSFVPSKKSYFERVAIRAAIMLPALLPAIILGMQSAYKRVCTTPIWYIPRIAPPLNNNALLPTECLSSPKNYNFLIFGRSDDIIFRRHMTTSSWNSSINFFVELYASLYNKGQVILPTFRLLWDLRIEISFKI